MVDLGELPDPQASDPYPAELDLPGIFQFGGWNAAAALAAPAPLWVYGGSSQFDVSWTKTAYAMCGAAHLLRLDPPAQRRRNRRWIDGGD